MSTTTLKSNLLITRGQSNLIATLKSERLTQTSAIKVFKETNI